MGRNLRFLTAFLSNLVAGLLVILLLVTLDRFQARPSLGELAVVSEAVRWGKGSGGPGELNFSVSNFLREALNNDFFWVGESKPSHLL